ncbi:GNAT family N-acetyltransferase [Pontibacter sp. E15-1]|uniref:GNAT family N-acetyltransferase n=1 Tax=Pontibacter sp. E15-1 TaxID=2919918 RepID=UPI001F4F97E9|nr:GNAT family N-acetyltransferase [Pontibacter sp. E15-1]MCJ8166661.1 GNAT family N-acetyltransferase [Pontibacter sp. E15-1]
MPFQLLYQHVGYSAINMQLREATISDIRQIQIVRHSVKENTLSNPERVTDADCEEFLTKRGKGWVCEIDGLIVGFAIADLKDNNIWALFLRPEFEGRGFGHQLHELMLDWYFGTGKENVWLGTLPNTRAEKFYRKKGWKETGLHGDKEIEFEMTRADWLEKKHEVYY